MIYIESPAGVGFSTAKGDAAMSQNDMQSSMDNLAAINAWFDKFPEYKNHDLYVSGESYGGIYVPYLAWQIYEQNLRAKWNTALKTIKIKGYLVGNGATNWYYDVDPTYAATTYNFNLIDDITYNNYTHNDCLFSFATAAQPFVIPHNNSMTCWYAEWSMHNLTEDLNWYDLYRPKYQ